MRVIFFIILSIIFAFSVDYYIYRRIIVKQRSKALKRAYIFYAIIVDTLVVIALLLNKYASDGDGTTLRMVMWMVGFFFFNAIPKSVYAVISLGDYLGGKKGALRKHIFGYIGTVLGAIVVLVLLHGMTYGRSEIRVVRVEIEFPSLPASFDGLRVVQFNDNHIGTLMCRDRFLQKMVDSVNMLRPDIIVHAGDIVNNHVREFDQAAMDIFSKLKSSYGVYSVLGNHDLGIYIHDTVRYPVEEHLAEMIRRQEKLGWNVLRNSSLLLSNGVDYISISGVNYPEDLTLNSHGSITDAADIGATYHGVPDSMFNLTISHAPQIWDELLNENHADLTLAGHVHSMQMKIGLGKWKFSPARIFYDRWSGLYQENGRYLYINDGAGYVLYPMRVGTKPELTLFVLRSSRGSEGPGY